MDFITALAVGIGLAAASGLRVFVPLLFLSVGVKLGYVTPGEDWAWIGSWSAVAGLGLAAALEVAAYYVPILDNALDALATPAAAISGTMVAAVPIMAALDQVHPGLGWLTAAVAGGGTATAVQAVTVTARAASTATTAGAGNPIVASIENTGATLLSIVTLVLPLAIGGLMVLLAGLLAWRMLRPGRGVAVAA
jgi:hypothetical protein